MNIRSMVKLSYIYAKLIQILRGKAVLRCTIHPTAKIGSACNVIDTTMGRYSYCSHDTVVVNAKIGSFCSISDHVYIGGAEHPTEWVSMSPVFQNVRHSGPTKRFVEFDLPPVKQTIIGNDVWIGHGVTIKQGVSIGHGAVVGSNALVTKDVPPYAIVGGVPAKLIKYRFDNQTIQGLLSSKWWDMSENELNRYSNRIKKPNDFLRLFTPNKRSGM